MAGEDPERLDWIRAHLPCCAPGAPSGCRGHVEPHHHTQYRSMSQRAPDSVAIPLCSEHHRAFHDGRGPFAEWYKSLRRAWQDEQVDLCQCRWDRHCRAEHENPLHY